MAESVIKTPKSRWTYFGAMSDNASLDISSLPSEAEELYIESIDRTTSWRASIIIPMEVLSTTLQYMQYGSRHISANLYYTNSSLQLTEMDYDGSASASYTTWVYYR